MAIKILSGDCRELLATLPEQSVHTCITSPPYFGLRDYGIDGQIGLESSVDAYSSTLVQVFQAVRRVLRDDGTLWLVLGDSYATNGGPHVAGSYDGGTGRAMSTGRLRKVPSGLKSKDLMMIPATVALALRTDGWYLRSDIIWHKPNAMPESVKDRPTSAHEHIFLFSKQPSYYFDQDGVRESGGPNIRNVWTIASRALKEAHFATFPPALVEPCIKAGCPHGGIVLDPFAGSGTTLLVADRLGREGIGIELNPDYVALATRRITNDAPMFATLIDSNGG